MGWKQTIDYVEAEPLKVRKTAKTYWDSDTNDWKNTAIYRVLYQRNLEDWLRENYPTEEKKLPLGWNMSFNHMIVNEKIYLHYCLVKPE